MELVSTIAEVVTALATLSLGLVGFRFTRSADRATAERAIGDLANTMAGLRIEHPRAMRLARQWEREVWTTLYEGNDEDAVRYYAYVDVGLEFCSTALRARDRKLISRESYDLRYGRLVRLFLVENWRIVSQMEATSPYLSEYVRREIAEARAAGWDWDARHAALAVE